MSDLPNLHRPNKSTILQMRSTNSTRSASVLATRSKFQNVEKLTDLIEQLQKKQGPRKKDPNLPEKALESFKEKIKATVNSLYDSYDNNKELIVQQIKALEKNKASQAEISARFELSLKEKNTYDKLRVEVRAKQKKLEQLRAVLEKEKGFTLEGDLLKQQLDARLEELVKLQVTRENLDYKKAVLLNTREQRRSSQRVLKKRFQENWSQWCDKKRALDKYFNQNEAKKLLLAKLESKMPAHGPEIPQKLAVELETKLEQIYGKHAYEQIFERQNILAEEEFQQEQRQLELQRRRFIKEKEDAERRDKLQYEVVEGQYLLKKSEEEKIRKLCGVTDLYQISENHLGLDHENLDRLKEEFQGRLQEARDRNDQLRKEIQELLQSPESHQDNIRTLDKSYTQYHEEEKKLSNHVEKSNSFLEELQFIVQRISGQGGPKKDINLMLAAFSSKFQKLLMVGMDASSVSRDKNASRGTTETFRQSKIPTTTIDQSGEELDEREIEQELAFIEEQRRQHHQRHD